MKKQLTSSMIGLAAFGLALAACGPQSAEVEVTMTDFAFDPAEVSVPALLKSP